MRFYTAFLALFFAFLPLAGCGFSPLYGTPGQSATAQATLNTIAIANIPDREGQFLRNRLIDRFYHDGYPASPAYHLSFSPLVITKTDLDLTKTATATRAQYGVRTTMLLADAHTGKAVLTRTLYASASYDILASRFTTRVTEKNASESALSDIARQAEQQIVLALRKEDK